MSFQCPCCTSRKIAYLQPATKIAAFVGTVVGATHGVSTALIDSQLGPTAGALISPLGIKLGSLSSAVLGGFVGSVGGCALGAQLGEKLDRYALANNLCLVCGHRFNLPT